MKTSELEGVALDWAVAKCEGHDVEDITWWVDFGNDCCYSTDWAQGGPIIEREGICLYFNPEDANAFEWHAEDRSHAFYLEGPTPLIAAMRCYVASKLGADVYVP
jgi:hypothetical protein